MFKLVGEEVYYPFLSCGHVCVMDFVYKCLETKFNTSFTYVDDKK